MTSGRWKTRTERIALCVLLPLIVTLDCSGPDDDEDPPPTVSEQIRELEPALRFQPPSNDTNEDRDPDAITAALWRLDPCKLIAPARGERGAVEQYSPHGCELAIGQIEMDVDLGMRLEPGERWGLDATEVAGAKAYLLPGSRPYRACTAWLPVSFDQSIRVESELARCGRVRSVLERIVKRVDAASSQRVPGIGARDTCTLLRRALGARIKGRTTMYGSDDSYGGIDRCVAVPETLPSSLRWSTSTYAELELESSGDAASGWPVEFGTVRGRQVFGARTGFAGHCVMRWAESATVLTMYAPSCEQGRSMIARIAKLLRATPDEPGSPQRPLLYGSEEPDRAASGVCTDYMPLSVGRRFQQDMHYVPGPACHPYVEPEVPERGPEAVVTAEADPNVTCAVAADAVHQEFPGRLRPATLDADLSPAWTDQPPFRVRPCVFVDPERKIQVQVFVSSDPMPIDEEAADLLEESGSNVGIPLVRYGTGFLKGLGERPDEPGYVAVFAGRRHQQSSTAGDYGLMQGARDDAARVVEAIIDEHLSD